MLLMHWADNNQCVHVLSIYYYAKDISWHLMAQNTKNTCKTDLCGDNLFNSCEVFLESLPANCLAKVLLLTN